MNDGREYRLIKDGDFLIDKIEGFRLEKGRLPNSLEEIGYEERDGVDVLYYDKRDSTHYTISFGTSLGESKFYYSDSQQWEDRYRDME